MSKIGDRIRRQSLLPTDTKPQFLPSQQLAGRIARLQATPEARSQGLDFQRAFQGGLSDHDLRRVGLQRLEEKSPGLLKRLGGGALGGAIRILDTPSQMSLRFLTALRGGSYENPIEALGGALKGTGQRRDFFDATGIKRRGGVTGGLINFLGTVATDPLTGFAFGATGAARTAIKEIAKEFGQETAEHVARHGLKATKGMTKSRLKDIKKLPSLQGKNLAKVEKGIQGGVRYFGKQVLKGETVRAPLRRRGLIDPIRPMARFGTPVTRETAKIARPFSEFEGRLVPKPTFLQSRGMVNPRLAGKQSPSGVQFRNWAKKRTADEASVRGGIFGGKLPISEAPLRKAVRGKFEPVTRRLNTANRAALGGLADVFNRLGIRAGVTSSKQFTENAAKLSALRKQALKEAKSNNLNFDDVVDDIIDVFEGMPEGLGLKTQLLPDGSKPLTPLQYAAKLKDQGQDALADYVHGIDEVLSYAREARIAAGRSAQDSPNVQKVIRKGEREYGYDQDPFGLNDPSLDLTPPPDEGLSMPGGGRFLEDSGATFTGRQKVVTPSLGSDVGAAATRLKRQATPWFRKWLQDHPMYEAEFNNILRGNYSIKETEKILQGLRSQYPDIPNFPDVRFPGAKGDFLETDPDRIALYMQNQAQRYHSQTEFVDAATEVIDPTTGEKLIRKVHLYENAPVVHGIPYEKINIGSLSNMGDEVWVHPELAPEIKRFNDQIFDPQMRGKLTQAFDDWLNLWKGLATVPIFFGVGFHMRNGLGNFYNNSMAGVHFRWYKPTIKIQKVIADAAAQVKKASPFDDLSDTATLRRAPAGTRDPNGKIFGSMDEGTPRGGQFQTRETGIIQEMGPRFGESGTKTNPNFEKVFRNLAAKEGISDKHVQWVMDAIDEGVLSTNFMQADLGDDLLQAVRSDSDAMWDKVRQQFTNPRQSVLIKSGSIVGQHIENNARLAHFFSKMDDGLTAADSGASVRKYLFDYSDVTDFEKNVMKRIIPFYTFMRKNTPLQLSDAILNPRRILATRRLHEGIAEVKDENLNALPSFALKDGQVPLASGIASWIAGGGNVPVTGGLDLPTNAAFDTIDPFVQIAAQLPGLDNVLPDEFNAEDRSEIFRGLIGLPGGGVTEVTKYLIENATETDLFTGAPLKPSGGSIESLRRFTEAVMPVYPKISDFADYKHVFGVNPLPEEEVSKAKLRFLKQTLGISLTLVDPRRERGEIYRRLDALDAEINRQRNMGLNVPTITDLRKEGLVPSVKEVKEWANDDSHPLLTPKTSF